MALFTFFAAASGFPSKKSNDSSRKRENKNCTPARALIEHSLPPRKEFCSSLFSAREATVAFQGALDDGPDGTWQPGGRKEAEAL